jgi:predicted 2-oxoglutarate/Fe(II)-dependent dioxygenase YbiX
MTFILNQYDKIHYYTNAIPNPQEIINIVEETDHLLSDQTALSQWKDWGASDGLYTFGKQKKEIIENKGFGPEQANYVLDKIKTSIINVSLDYQKVHGISIGELMPISISKYDTGKTMGSHVDFYGGEGPQPVISVVAYLNDDYEGGEIEFRDQNIKIKPEAGSIVIFPSKEPYFHASLPVISGIKYMTPGFWYIFPR